MLKGEGRRGSDIKMDEGRRGSNIKMDVGGRREEGK